MHVPLRDGFEAPPDGGWGWLVVAAGFMVHFNCLGLQYTFGILFKALLDDDEFQRASGNDSMSTAASTWAGSISSSLMLLGSFPSGFLVQKYGMRPVAFSGVALMFLGLQAASSVKQLWMLYVTYGAITGAGFALLWSSSVIAVNRYFTTKVCA